MLNYFSQFQITQSNLDHIISFYFDEEITTWKKSIHEISNQTIFITLSNNAEVVLKIFRNQGSKNQKFL